MIQLRRALQDLNLAAVFITAFCSVGIYTALGQVPGFHAWLGPNRTMFAGLAAFLVASILLHRASLRYAGRGAFEAMASAALQMPWGEPLEVPGPWQELPELPDDARRVMPPVRGTTERVLAADRLGPTVLTEANDLGLCLVTRVGVTSAITRWLFVSVAREEAFALEDKRIFLPTPFRTREVLIVDMTRDGTRSMAWGVHGTSLPASYLPPDALLR